MVLDFTAPDMPDDLQSITDVDAREWMNQARRDRREKNVNFPRFVSAIRKAGYNISTEDYKQCESRPFTAIPHIRNGMLIAVYAVLNQARVLDPVQGPYTTRAMDVVREYRMRREFDFHEIARALRNVGVNVTAAEYRAAEQGMSKVVSVEFLGGCISVLQIPVSEVFNAN